MHKLLVEKVDEYDNFPLMVQLGFIHAIPEDDFDIASATIMDISFLGLFPKEIFQAMRKYGYKYEKSNQSEEIYALVAPWNIQKLRKVKQLEIEMLSLAVDNNVLAPLMKCRTKSMSIKTFRKMLAILPTFANKSRDDLIFGTARYLANTLCILLHDKPSSFLLDK